MITANAELRGYMRQVGVPYWKLAKKLNVAESTLIRWLREELPEAKKNNYMKLVDEIVRWEELINER